MANELRHNTVGAQLSQAEFEDVALHIFNSQAIGDTLYASSTTQLTRLAVGAANTIYSVQGGIPSWRTPANILTDLSGQAGAAFSWNSQNLTSVGTLNTHTIPGGTDTFVMLAASQVLTAKTLTAPVINGTVTTTGLTLPAVTLGGAIAGGQQDISNIGAITGGKDTEGIFNLKRTGTGAVGYEIGSSDATGGDFYLDISVLSGADYHTRIKRVSTANGDLQLENKGTGSIVLLTDNASMVSTPRFSLSGGAIPAVATWANVTHTGFAATDYIKLGITDTNGTVEGQIWYDASEDKLKFKTAAGVETITSG